MQIVKLLRTIATSSPRNNSQSGLNCVYFERKNVLDDSGFEQNDREKNHIKIIVTNRFYIIKVEVSPLFFPSLSKDGDSALFHRDSIINALKGMKTKDDITINSDESIANNYILGNKSFENITDIKFPAWYRPWKDASTPRSADVQNGIAINMKFLSVITDLMTSVTNKEANSLLTFGDELDTITFEFNGKSYTDGLYKVEACLMPVKLQQ